MCNKYFLSIFKAFCLSYTEQELELELSLGFLQEKLATWSNNLSARVILLDTDCDETAVTGKYHHATTSQQNRLQLLFCLTKYLLVGCLARWKPREFRTEEDVRRENSRKNRRGEDGRQEVCLVLFIQDQRFIRFDGARQGSHRREPVKRFISSLPQVSSFLKSDNTSRPAGLYSDDGMATEVTVTVHLVWFQTYPTSERAHVKGNTRCSRKMEQ